MAKKGKGKAGKGKKGKDGAAKKGERQPKKKLPKVTDCLSPPEMSKNQLLGFIQRLLKESDRELEERNLFMLEKSKLWSLWQLTLDKVSQLREEVRNSQVKIDKSEKERDSEKEMFNKKLRCLQNEEIKNFGIIRLNHLHYMRKLSDDIWAMENILRESAFVKKQNVRKTMGSYYEILRGLRYSHAKSITDMLLSLSHSMSSYEKGQDRKLFDRKSTWEENYLPFYDNLRQSKIGKLDVMFLAHDRSLLDMKTFFDDVLTNNLAVMTMLADEIDTQKLHENRLKRDLRWAKEKYLKIHDPLLEMMENLKIMDEANKQAERLMRDLLSNEKKLKSKEHCEHMLDVTVECLREQIAIAFEERSNARVEFGKTARKMQRQAQMRSLVCQLKSKAAEKDTHLFQALNSTFREPLPTQCNYYERLKRDKDRQILTYKHVAKLDPSKFEAFQSISPKCTEKQRITDFGALGLVNNFHTIHRPWQETSPIEPNKSTIPRYKEVLTSKYIFNQLPARQRHSSKTQANTHEEPSTNASRASSASTRIVKLFPKDLSHIASRPFPVTDLELDHKPSTTQLKLKKLIDKAEFRFQEDNRVDCTRNPIQPQPPKPVKFPLIKSSIRFDPREGQPFFKKTACAKRL